MHRSVRYSLTPRQMREDEEDIGLEPANLLRINFYENPVVGHTLIVSLWDTENPPAPGYMRPVIDWAPPEEIPVRRRDPSGYNHYWRTMGMWYALLYRAGFEPPEGLTAPINFRDNVKRDLENNAPGIVMDQRGRFSDRGQPITALPGIYRQVETLRREHGNDVACSRLLEMALLISMMLNSVY